MQIARFQPSKRIASIMHAIFASIYLLILIRTGIFLYEGPTPISILTKNVSPMAIINRVLGVVIDPFWAVGLPIPWSPNDQLPQAVIMAILVYALIHYGMFMSVNPEPSMSSMSLTNKILNLCKAVFFLAGALLILLIVIRMSFMLYQDLVYRHYRVTIESPKK